MDLIDAIQANDRQEVERLLQAGADPNASRDQRTALEHVPDGGDAICCALIEAGAWQPNLITRMVWAVTTGRPATVQALIDHGADLNKKTLLGTPLEVAARFGHCDIAERLIRAGADLDHGEPVSKAIAEQHTHLALLLLRNGARPGGLETAAWLGQTEVVRELLQRHVPVDQIHEHHRTIPLKDFTALHAAAQAENLQIVELLIGAGANPGLRDGEGRHAGDLGGPALKNIEFSRDLSHELQQAIEHNQPDTVRSLLQADAPLEERDSRRETRGFTPLMLAAARGRLEILEILLQDGANPEKADADTGREGLKRLAQFGGKEMLVGEALGHTALFCAARFGHAPLVERLLQAGADPNRRDFLEETPLIWAAEGGHVDALKALLQGGAQPNAKVLTVALEEKHPQCALELLEAGVAPDQKALVQAAYLAHAPVLAKMLALKPKLKAGKALAPVLFATRTVPAAEAPPGRWTTIFNQHGTFKRIPEPEEKMLEAIEILLQAGASVNEISSLGPALYVAASEGFQRVVQRLLEAGADPQIRYQDSSPVQVAHLMGHAEVVQLLSRAAPAAPPTPEPDKPKRAKAPKAPKAPKAIPQPRFKTMPDLVELEKTCGSPCTQPEYLRGGREVHLRNAVNLLSLQRQWLGRGVYLFHPDTKDSLAAIPADHWRVAIALMQTNGANCDVHTADVLKWLETLEKTQPFELTTIAHDRLEGVFKTPIADPKSLAKKMYRFCPDLVDQGCQTVEVLAEQLRRDPPELYFWWD